MKPPLLALVVACALALRALPAHSCGVSASGVASCSLAEHLEETRPHWAVGVSSLYTSTRLRFSRGLSGDETRAATLAVLAYLPTPALVLQAGAGIAFDGSLELPDGRHDFSPGPIGLLGLDWRVWSDGPWFALLTSGLSVSAARTHLPGQASVSYQALDVRLGGQLGVELASVLRPYAVARVFGGPVFWRYAARAVTGTDSHHFQLGAGLAVSIARSWNVFAEAIPLGERAASLGVAVAF